MSDKRTFRSKHKPFEFTLELTEVKNGEEVTVEKDYVIRPATGAARAKFVDARTDAIKVTPSGQIVGLKAGHLPTMLLGLTVFTPEGKKVTEREIEQWDGSIIEELFQIAIDRSNLRERDDKLLNLFKDLLNHPESGTTWEKVKEVVDGPDFKDVKYSVLRQLFNEREATEDVENF